MKILVATIALLCLDVCLCAEDKQTTDFTVPSSKEDGSNRLYFQGTDFTINLFPLVFLKIGLLIIAFLISGKDMETFASDTMGYFIGSESSPSGYGAPDTSYVATSPGTGYGAPATGYGTPDTGYGAPAPSYSAPAPSYSAPSTGYGTYASSRFAAAAANAEGGFTPGNIPLGGAQAQPNGNVNYYAQQQQQQQQVNPGVQNIVFGTPTDRTGLGWQQPAESIRTYAHVPNHSIDRAYEVAHDDDDLAFSVGTSLDFGARVNDGTIAKQMGFDSAEKRELKEYEEMLSSVPQTVQSILNQAEGFEGSQKDSQPRPTSWSPVAGGLRRRK